MLHILVFFLHVLPIYAISSIPSFYHSSEAILEELNNLSTNCPGATLILTTTTKETSTIPLTIATFTSKQTPDKTPHNRAMIIFGEHARELISPETALRMAQDLCGMNEKTKELALKVLESTSIAMVPIANPLGRKAVEDSWENMCQRVNENGVDLNRNWDAHWEAPLDKSDYNYNADTNSGPKPFSEPETQALKKILDDTQPTIFITVHSGTLGMYTPYAYSRDLPTNDPSDLGRMKNILDALDPEYCKCPSGAAGLDVGYLCPGTCLDYAYEHHASVSFAFEIYAGDADEIHAEWEQSHSQTLIQIQNGIKYKEEKKKDLSQQRYSCFLQTSHQHHVSFQRNDTPEQCFNMFNPPDETSYTETVSKWSEAFLKMCDMAATSALVRDVAKNEEQELNRLPVTNVGGVGLKGNQGSEETRRVAIAQPAVEAVEHLLRMKQTNLQTDLQHVDAKQLRGAAKL